MKTLEEYEYKNTKSQGDAGLGIAISYFTVNSYCVCVPLTDSQDYDLVVEFPDGLKKVQVRTCTYFADKRYTVNLRIMGGNTKSNFVQKLPQDIHYDYLFAVIGNGGQYLIPKEDIKHLRSGIRLGGPKYLEYKVN